MIRRIRKSTLGTSLVEAVMALGIVGVVTSGMYALNGQVMNLVKSNQQASASSLVLQERVEQLRIANWRQVTDLEFITNTLLGSDVRSASSLGQLSETVKISGYPNPEAIDPIIVSRESGSAAVVTSQGGNFLTQSLARVDVTIEFTGPDGRSHTRQSSTVMSKSGVSRLNIASATGGAAVPTPTPTPAAGPTPTPAPGSPSPTPTPSPTPVPTTNGNGNGNGNGNSNGNNGNGRGTVGGASGRG